jgi:hypothetical protein
MFKNLIDRKSKRWIRLEHMTQQIFQLGGRFNVAINPEIIEVLFFHELFIIPRVSYLTCRPAEFIICKNIEKNISCAENIQFFTIMGAYWIIY